MTNTAERLSELSKTARRIDFDDTQKFALMSDCHRGDGSSADDFAPNASLFTGVLRRYYEGGFTYIELGDGDELWENLRLAPIRKAHPEVFDLLRQFAEAGRFLPIWGNHDIDKKVRGVVDDALRALRRAGRTRSFKAPKAEEALRLFHVPSGHSLLLAHGHQGSFLGDRFWILGWFVVRYLWRPLQLLGFKDPTSVSLDAKQQDKSERQLRDWSLKNNQILIAGHTHIHRFPKPGEAPYFNTGCCIVPGSITAIEIAGGEIALVEWRQISPGTFERTERLGLQRRLDSLLADAAIS